MKPEFILQVERSKTGIDMRASQTRDWFELIKKKVTFQQPFSVSQCSILGNTKVFGVDLQVNNVKEISHMSRIY